MLSSTPLLHPPDLNKPLFLWIDAFSKGFGALFEQVSDDSKRYPIAYVSRQANMAESNYAHTELREAALVYTVEHLLYRFTCEEIVSLFLLITSH